MNKSKKVVRSGQKRSRRKTFLTAALKSGRFGKWLADKPGFTFFRNKKVSRLQFAGICCAAFLLTAVGIAGGIYHHRSITVSAAFYRLPEPVVTELTKQILQIKPKHSEFFSIQPEKELPRDVSKKYDLLFTWQGKKTELLAEKTIEPPEKLYNFLPTAIRQAGRYNGKNYAVPLLLDNYELAFYRTYRNTARLKLPQTLPSFENYLGAIKEYADTPLMCAGAEDSNLTGLVSALTESMCGKAGYEKLISQLGTSADLLAVLSADLVPGVPFSAVLDKIRSWQQKGLILSQWYNATQQDVLTMMKHHLIGVLFMTLTEHRQIPLLYIKYYDAVRFPGNPAAKDHALVAPLISGLMFRSSAGEPHILEQLVLTKNQQKLSTASKLGPTSSRAEAHDRQADDVRFWAASCAGGPVPDLSAAAFSTREQAAAFAAAVRQYLEK